MTEHEEHIARRLADGWYALHFCQECQEEKQQLLTRLDEVER